MTFGKPMVLVKGMRNVIVIGVSGGSASGKTTVANRIKDAFQDSVELLSHDFYYLPFDEIPFEERVKLNFFALP